MTDDEIARHPVTREVALAAARVALDGEDVETPEDVARVAVNAVRFRLSHYGHAHLPDKP